MGNFKTPGKFQDFFLNPLRPAIALRGIRNAPVQIAKPLVSLGASLSQTSKYISAGVGFRISLYGFVSVSGLVTLRVWLISLDFLEIRFALATRWVGRTSNIRL